MEAHCSTLHNYSKLCQAFTNQGDYGVPVNILVPWLFCLQYGETKTQTLITYSVTPIISANSMYWSNLGFLHLPKHSWRRSFCSLEYTVHSSHFLFGGSGWTCLWIYLFDCIRGPREHSEAKLTEEHEGICRICFTTFVTSVGTLYPLGNLVSLIVLGTFVVLGSFQDLDDIGH